MKNRTKKIFAVVLSAIIFISMVAIPASVFAAPATPDTGDEGKEPAGTPQLYIKAIDMQFFTQGVTNPLSFTVANNNGESAINIKISACGQGDYKDKFSIVQGTNTYVGIDSIFDERSVQTGLKIDGTVPDGVYNVDFNFSFVNSDGVAATITETCIIYVTGSNDSRPYIKSISFDKSEIGKDNKVKMTANLVNPTSATLYGVKLALRAEESKDFTLYENFQPKVVSSLAPNSSTKVEFSVYVAPSVTSGNYPVAFNLTFMDKDAQVTSYLCPIYASIKRTADADGDKSGSTPRIIVSKYSTSVEQIEAGKSFILDFTLQNTSTSNVGNMKVTIGSAVVAATGTGTGTGTGSSGDVFFPTAGSNSFYIEKLGPKQTVSKQIELMAKQDVEPGVYQVVLDIQYENDSAAPFKSEENIAFNVNQNQRLDIVGFTTPPDGSVGMPIPFSFQYINKGKATIYNLTVTTDGAFELDGGDLYVGNLTAGYNDYFDGSIMPTGTAGEQKGALVLKFEDSQGKSKELRKDFTINLMEMGNMGDVGNMGGVNMGKPIAPDGMTIDPETGELIPVKKGSIVWIFVVIGVVLVGGAVTFIVIRKKRKAKKELLLNEED